MPITVSPTQSQIQAALSAFLTGVLPATVEVIEGQDNLVPEPTNSDYVVMTPIRRERLATNLDVYTDAVFTGSIAGNVLTISATNYGTIGVNSPVFGVGVASGSIVTGLGTGTGGIGTYTISPGGQTVASIEIAAGLASVMQATKLTIQLDVHGPNSSDNAEIISTLFRDDYAVQSFVTSGFDIKPLYADDPRQMPFQNAENQTEYRYVIDAVLQANQLVTGIPQQFAEKVYVNVLAPLDLAGEFDPEFGGDFNQLPAGDQIPAASQTP